jgi:hypothetical protein
MTNHRCDDFWRARICKHVIAVDVEFEREIALHELRRLLHEVNECAQVNFSCRRAYEYTDSVVNITDSRGNTSLEISQTYSATTNNKQQPRSQTLWLYPCEDQCWWLSLFILAYLKAREYFSNVTVANGVIFSRRHQTSCAGGDTKTRLVSDVLKRLFGKADEEHRCKRSLQKIEHGVLQTFQLLFSNIVVVSAI